MHARLAWILALLVAGCSQHGGNPAPPARAPSEAPALDRTDAASTARAIIAAFRARDYRALADLATSDGRPFWRELEQQGERDPRYRSIQRRMDWAAVRQWDGTVGEVRYWHRKSDIGSRIRAQVQFGMLGPDELAVVTLEWENGSWGLEDFHSPHRPSFEEGSKTMPKP